RRGPRPGGHRRTRHRHARTGRPHRRRTDLPRRPRHVRAGRRHGTDRRPHQRGRACRGAPLAGLAPVRPGRGDPVKDGVKRPPARRPAVLSLRTALRSALRTALLRLLLALGLPVLLVTGWWFASAGSTDVYWPPLRTVLETGREVWTAERITAD